MDPNEKHALKAPLETDTEEHDDEHGSREVSFVSNNDTTSGEKPDTTMAVTPRESNLERPKDSDYDMSVGTTGDQPETPAHPVTDSTLAEQSPTKETGQIKTAVTSLQQETEDRFRDAGRTMLATEEQVIKDDEILSTSDGDTITAQPNIMSQEPLQQKASADAHVSELPIVIPDFDLQAGMSEPPKITLNSAKLEESGTEIDSILRADMPVSATDNDKTDNGNIQTADNIPHKRDLTLGDSPSSGRRAAGKPKSAIHGKTTSPRSPRRIRSAVNPVTNAVPNDHEVYTDLSDLVDGEYKPTLEDMTHLEIRGFQVTELSDDLELLGVKATIWPPDEELNMAQAYREVMEEETLAEHADDNDSIDENQDFSKLTEDILKEMDMDDLLEIETRSDTSNTSKRTQHLPTKSATSRRHAESGQHYPHSPKTKQTSKDDIKGNQKDYKNDESIDTSIDKLKKEILHETNQKYALEVARVRENEREKSIQPGTLGSTSVSLCVQS